MKLIEIIKKHGMLLVAGLAVIGFSSFKMIEKTTFSEVWFTFNSPLNPSDGVAYEEAVLEPSNYTNTGSPTNPVGCNDTQKVCAISAEPDANGNIPQATLDMHESDLLNPASTNPNISRKLND